MQPVSLRVFLLGVPVIFSLMGFLGCHHRDSVCVNLTPFALSEVPLMVPAPLPFWAGILLVVLFPTVCDLQRAVFAYRGTFPAFSPSCYPECGATAL